MKSLFLLLFLLVGPALSGALACAFCDSPASAEPAPTTAYSPRPSKADSGGSSAPAPAPGQPERATVFRRIPAPHTFTFM